MKIIIENGYASLFFDFERWEELHEIAYNFDEAFDLENIYSGPYDIATKSGKVVDACIGMVYDLDNFDYGFIVPSVILLMEDGSLEWFLADPINAILHNNEADKNEVDKTIFSLAKLPWLKGITSLAYELEVDGVGELTINAYDKNRNCYDVRIPINFSKIFNDKWICELGLSDYGYPSYCMLLKFEEDGNVTLEKSGEFGEIVEIYKGKYDLSLGDDTERQTGIMTFELNLDWWIWEGDGNISSPEKIYGSYFVAHENDELMDFWLSEGDLLHKDGFEDSQYYQFWLLSESSGSENGEMNGASDIRDWNDEKLIDFLLTQVPEAYDKIHLLGMSALVTGETTDFEEENGCRDVWLGTNHESHFVKEILYTIGPSGRIYVYDILLEAWSIATDY